MALDAHPLYISASLSCAELERIRCVATESLAKSLSCTRGSKKKHGGQGGKALMSPCTVPLMSQVLICSRPCKTVCTLCNEGRHCHALRTGYWTEETFKTPVARSMQPGTSDMPVHDQRGWPGKYSPSLSSWRKPYRSEETMAARSSRFSAGIGLQADCGFYCGHPKWRDTTVTAAATDSDQTSPNQNGGGEKGLPKKPHPEVAPSQVVQAQLKALHDRDLGLVYEFASPANKAHTGPLSRFSEMLEARPYRVMIGHVSADVLSTVSIGPNRFQQRIMIKGPGGTEAIFSWSLSKQEEGPYEGCWMTDTVRRDDH